MRRPHIPLVLATVFTAVMSAVALQVTDPPKPAFSAKVVGIADGDTLTVLLNERQSRVRLEGIDAPESGQAFGTKARQSLADKVFSKEVTVKWQSKDRYGRILGHVYLGDRHINIELLREGFAWHYLQYNQDPELAKAERQAKAAGLGLWSDSNPVAPWVFRHGVRTSMMKQLLVEPDGAKAPTDEVVYVTRSGTKYHSAACGHLSKSSIAMPLADAKRRYGPCSVCKPPR